jgi:hypothetical protein
VAAPSDRPGAQQQRADGRAEGARYVRLAFGPVDATEHRRPPAANHRFDIDPDGAEYVSSDIRDHERGSLRHYLAPPYEPFGDRHAEPPARWS